MYVIFWFDSCSYNTGCTFSKPNYAIKKHSELDNNPIISSLVFKLST